MARRKHRARNTRPAARWLDWSPAIAALFRLAGQGDWTPPAQARLSGGLHRQTLSARFVDADGVVMTARIRLARCPVSGERFVTGEELSIPLGTLRGGPEG